MSSSSDNNSESDYEEDSVDDSESEDDFDTRLENFTKSLEDSLKEAQKYNLKVPEQDLSSLNKILCAHFSLDSKNLQVKSAFEAAKKINESFVGFKTLTFSTSKPANCVSTRGRYSYFDRGTYLKRIRCLTNYECIPGYKHAVANFGSDFRMIEGTSQRIKNKAPNISMSKMLNEKEIHFRGWTEILEYIEDDSDNTAYAYTKDLKIRLFMHTPENVEVVGIPKFKVKHGSVYPKLELSTDTEFKVKTNAEFEYEATKGFSPRAWTKWLSAGINCIWDDEKKMTFDSPQFVLELIGNKHLLEPKSPPNIELSKEAAKKFVKNVQIMRAYQERLKKEDDLAMLENKIKDSQNDLNEEAAAELVEQSVDVSMMSLESTLKQLQILNAFKDRYSSTWILNIGAASVSAEYLMGIRPLSSTMEIIKITDKAMEALQAGADQAVLETCLHYSKTIENFPKYSDLPTGDTNTLNSFAFEELMNAKIMSESLKKGVPLELVKGDGIGVLTNADGVQVQVPEYIDVVVKEVGGDSQMAVQYKCTRNEFNPNAQGDTVHNVDSMVDSWTHKWEGHTVDTNLPQELRFENVEVIVPKGSAEDAVTNRATDKFEMDTLKVDSPSATEMDKFIEQNYDKLKQMADTMKDVRKLEDIEKGMVKDLEKLERAKANMEKSLESNPSNNELNAKLKQKETEINTKVSELKKARKDVSDKRMELEDHSKKSHWDEKGVQKQRAERNIEKMRLKSQFKATVMLAAAISSGQELIISLAEEISSYNRGDITFGTMAKNVTIRTSKALVIGGGIGGIFASAQYGLGRLAMSQTNSLAALGNVGGKLLGPAMMIGCLGYQSYNIIQSFRAGEIDKPEMALQFTRMAGMTGGSMACFYFATAAVSSTGVGLAIGAVACIGLGVADHFLFKKDEEKALEKQYQVLRKEVIDKAYEIFDLEEHCTDKELKRAYFAAVKKYHPDKKKDDDEDDQVKAIIIAYELLKSVRNSK